MFEERPENFHDESERSFLFYKVQKRIADCLCEIAKILRQVLTAHSAKLLIGGNEMPADILIGGTATAVLHEWTGPGGTGMEVAPIGPVTYASSDATIATVDPNSGVVTGVGPGVATITGTDAGNSLNAADTVTVSVPVAVSATLVITPAAAGKSLPRQRP